MYERRLVWKQLYLQLCMWLLVILIICFNISWLLFLQFSPTVLHQSTIIKSIIITEWLSRWFILYPEGAPRSGARYKRECWLCYVASYYYGNRVCASDVSRNETLQGGVKPTNWKSALAAEATCCQSLACRYFWTGSN